METKVITREAIVGKHVEFNSRELEQMAEMCDKIATVLDNHEKKDEKKIYLSDDDLYRLESIFMCILESEADFARTVFDCYELTLRNNRRERFERKP